MESASLVAASALLLLTGVLVAVLLRGRAASQRELAAARAETEALRIRLDDLSSRWEETSAAMSNVVATSETAYVITDAGSPDPLPVPDRVVLSATLGAPLVKAAALGHGVRRALSAESRNRIWFEVRREVRASRRRRRREDRALLREARAAQRARETEVRPDAAA
jgi:hypothetical protein